MRSELAAFVHALQNHFAHDDEKNPVEEPNIRMQVNPSRSSSFVACFTIPETARLPILFLR